MRTISESCLVLLLCCVSVSSMRDPDLGLLVTCRPPQIQSFTQFKNEFDTHHCNQSDNFNGIWCDNTTGAVTKLQLRACLSGTLKPNSILFMFHHLRYLDLSQNNFTSSTLPSEFGKLNRLEVLSLSSNGFIGPVPSSFSNLTLLSILDLSSNKFSGSFQFVWSLSKLTVLRLSQNHFSGTLDSKHSLFELYQLTYLDLSENNFTSSSLPYELGNLYKLEVLSLSSNGFFGQVPPTISNLTLLRELYLDANELTGGIPLVQNLTKLSTLRLFDNHFSGTIPSSLFTMPSLSYLELWGNGFNGSFEVPNSSSRLKRLYLGHNNLDEKILEPISKLINLKELDVSFLNTSYPLDLSLFSSLKSLLLLDVSGVRISQASLSSSGSFLPSTLEALRFKQCNISEFPNIFKTLGNLVHISLSKNIISGKVPEWIWSLPRLNSVFIDGNLLHGFEGSPEEVLVNSSVQIIFMHSNSFEGALPQLPLSISFFNAQANNFSGDIPLSVCNRSSLTVFDLSYNNLTGPLPQCLSNFFFVNLRKNNLEGSIPDKFYVDSPLRSLDLSHNRLTGKLPRSLLNCSTLQFLSADYNRIQDTFPFSYKALPNLQVLILSSNRLYGPLSSSNQGPLGFPELRILEIGGNELTGSLPPDFFVNWKASSLRMNEDVGQYMVYKKVIYGTYFLTYRDSVDLPHKGLFPMEDKILTSYATIDFSGNRFKGQIPESIGLLRAVIALNLANNAFTGPIPLSLVNLMKLESLDLSRNQLSGTIPGGLGSLSFLAYINVSHNQLTGEIPHGTQIIGQPKSCFEGNPGLCGFPLEESCFGTKTPPPAKEYEEEEEEVQLLNWKGVAISYVPGVLLGLAIAQFIPSYKLEWLLKIIGRHNY